MKCMIVATAIALSGCGTTQVVQEHDIWVANGERVALMERGSEQGLNELSGISFRHYGPPCVWKAMEVQPGKWLVSMESTGRFPPETREFQTDMLSLGEQIARRMP